MKKVAIIGIGTMGGAIATQAKAHFEVVEIDQGDDISMVKEAEMVVLAVKPQSFAELANGLRQYIDQQIVISIMAGINIARISDLLAANQVVRTMPNLGLQAGKSVTAVYSTNDIQEDVYSLLNTWGEVIKLKSEQEFDAFTAIAGSGPAYFFELTNHLQQAAEARGFDTNSARQIANATLHSAAAALSVEQVAAEKVQQVASKGGTTEAALKVLAEKKFGNIVDEAVEAAAKRSKELSS